MGEQSEILIMDHVSVAIANEKTQVYPVRDVSFAIPKGKVVGMVGESGCGKSMTARSIMHLMPSGGRIASGRILFDGYEISNFSEKQMLGINGKYISMIFQEPMSSLNPVVKAGRQVEEVLRLHTDWNRDKIRSEVISIFHEVGIPEPEKRYHAYPFQLSGGLRQRVMIAMAMVMHPKLLIADEPTTALDVTIEAQILRLMKKLQNDYRMSILMITHNLGVVSTICDFVNVMYLGEIVESCDVETLFKNPQHPYTRGLIASVPRISRKKNELTGIDGTVPNLSQIPAGCGFCTRCPYAQPSCGETHPALTETEKGHFVRCSNIPATPGKEVQL